MVVDFWNNVADAAIGLRRASKSKETWTKKYCVFYCRARKKNVTSYDISCKILVRTSTANRWRSSKENTWPQYEKKNKSNNWNHIFQLQRQSRGPLEDTKTAVALPHCSESTRDSIAGWWAFLLEVTTGVMAELRNVVRKKKRR